MAAFSRPHTSPRSPVVRRRTTRGRASYGRARLAASGFGQLGSGIFVALGVVAVHAGGLAPLAVLLAGLVALAAAAAYAEGVSLFPEAGGAAAVAGHAFDELASFVTGWATALALVATAALSATFAARYLSVFWEPLATARPAAAGGLVIVALAAAVAARRLELPGGLSAFAGALDAGLQLLLVLLGLLFVFRPGALQAHVHLGTAPSVGGLVLACALAMAAFTGLESIGELAAEARDPDRDLAPAASTALLGALLLAAGIALVAAMALPSRSADETALPVLGVVAQVPLHVLASGLAYVIGLLVAALLVVVAHAALARCGRLALWQAEHRQLPSTAAPVAPVAAAAGVLVAVQGAVGGANLLVATYAFGALASFTCLSAATIALRWRDPGRHRPVAAPLDVRIAGRRLPLVAMLGGVAAAACLVAVVALDPVARYTGSAWMLAGVATYAAYRRRQGLSLGERARRPPGDRGGPGVEVELRTMLIPVNTASKSAPADLLDVAAQLAGERRACLIVLAFTEIPLGEEMDLEIDDLDEGVERLAAAGRAVGERYGIRVHTTHLRTRDPAEAILAEANRRDAQAIVLRATGLERSEPRRHGYDQAVRRIVAEARQRVMIVRPEQAAT